jgi:hypothetical protein
MEESRKRICREEEGDRIVKRRRKATSLSGYAMGALLYEMANEYSMDKVGQLIDSLNPTIVHLGIRGLSMLECVEDIIRILVILLSDECGGIIRARKFARLFRVTRMSETDLTVWAHITVFTAHKQILRAFFSLFRIFEEQGVVKYASDAYKRDVTDFIMNELLGIDYSMCHLYSRGDYNSNYSHFETIIRKCNGNRVVVERIMNTYEVIGLSNTIDGSTTIYMDSDASHIPCDMSTRQFALAALCVDVAHVGPYQYMTGVKNAGVVRRIVTKMLSFISHPLNEAPFSIDIRLAASNINYIINHCVLSIMKEDPYVGHGLASKICFSASRMFELSSFTTPFELSSFMTTFEGMRALLALSYLSKESGLSGVMFFLRDDAIIRNMENILDAIERGEICENMAEHVWTEVMQSQLKVAPPCVLDIMFYQDVLTNSGFGGFKYEKGVFDPSLLCYQSIVECACKADMHRTHPKGFNWLMDRLIVREAYDECGGLTAVLLLKKVAEYAVASLPMCADLLYKVITIYFKIMGKHEFARERYISSKLMEYSMPIRSDQSKIKFVTASVSKSTAIRLLVHRMREWCERDQSKLSHPNTSRVNKRYYHNDILNMFFK